MRVLLVEDNGRFAPALSSYLAADAIRIEHAEIGQDALYLLRHYEFDLALLGSQLTDMDAVGSLSRIRSAKHHTPVVAFSAAPQARLRALAAGADDVVERDINRDELAHPIQRIEA